MNPNDAIREDPDLEANAKREDAAEYWRHRARKARRFVPYAVGSATSKKAAEHAKRFRGRQVDRVIGFLDLMGLYGATDEEIGRALDMNMNSVRPRRGELEDEGAVIDSGRTRKTASGHDAVVWIATWHRKPQSELFIGREHTSDRKAG